ncbi:MAG: HEAT repeat domain-containing protein [Polyangiaceae bacterium]
MSLLALAGCGGVPGTRAIANGDFPTFRKDVGGSYRLGRLTNHDAAELARASLEGLFRAPRSDDRERLDDLAACARDLDDVFARRAEAPDAIGAEAALARVVAGSRSPGDFDVRADDPRDAARAIHVLGLDGEDDARNVVGFLERDPSPVVRRAAVRVLGKARTPAAADALVEAARVDPEPWVRAEAVRAVGFASHAGGDTVANRLRDLWDHADDGLRQDVANAWTEPAVFSHGGRDALRVLLARETGPAAIAAAGSILRRHELRDDREIVAAAWSIVLRAILAGSKREQVHGIAVAPDRPCPDGGRTCDDAKALRLALEKRAYDSPDGDADVTTAARARLAADDGTRQRAVAALVEEARVPGASGRTARNALARLGDPRVQAWIESDLVSPDSAARSDAGRALADLGRSARAVPLLADPDVRVRTRAACWLVRGARTNR